MLSQRKFPQLTVATALPSHYIVPGFIFLAVLIIFIVFSGGPITWDELLYMNLAVHPTQEAWVLNRYFHVYLQMPFYWLAGDPQAGVRLFWAFLMASTTTLIYVSTSLLCQHKHFLNGLVALAFFFAQRMVMDFAGVAYADFTVMTLTTVAITLYLVYHRTRYRHPWLMVALGLTFFCAVKSKEVGICIGVLFLGVGFIDGTTFSSRHFIKNITLIGAGIISGFLLFMVLDFIFLEDALFGLRPTNLRALFGFNLGEWERNGNNYFDLLTNRKELFPVFLLYLMSVWRNEGERFKTADKILWLLPLVVILFITLTMIAGPWDMIPRYYAPAIPALCILAALFFQVVPEASLKNTSRSSLVILLVALTTTILGIAFILRFNTSSLWTPEFFYSAIVYTILLALLLSLLLMVRQWSFATIFYSLTILFILSLPSLTAVGQRLGQRVVAQEAERRFYPYAKFAEHIHYSDEMTFFVSPHIYDEYQMLCRREAEEKACCAWMFNIFFEETASPAQFTCSDSLELVLANPYTYALLTKADWEALTTAATSGQLASLYTPEFEPEGIIVFLHHK